MIFRTLLAATAALALSAPAVAQTDEAEPAAKADAAQPYEPNSASETFTGTFGGRSVRYTATVEEQVLKARLKVGA